MPITVSVVMVNSAPVWSVALTFLELPQTNFGTLQIEQDAGVHARLTRRFADRIDARGMVVLRAVRGVETEYVDAGGQQLTQNAGRIGGRAEGSYNFGIGQ